MGSVGVIYIQSLLVLFCTACRIMYTKLSWHSSMVRGEWPCESHICPNTDLVNVATCQLESHGGNVLTGTWSRPDTLLNCGGPYLPSENMFTLPRTDAISRIHALEKVVITNAQSHDCKQNRDCMHLVVVHHTIFYAASAGLGMMCTFSFLCRPTGRSVRSEMLPSSIAVSGKNKAAISSTALVPLKSLFEKLSVSRLIGLRCAFQSVVIEQLFDQVHVCHQHAPATVSVEAKRIQGISAHVYSSCISSEYT